MDEKSTKLMSGLFLFLTTLFLITMFITDIMNGEQFSTTNILIFVVLLISWFQFFTWGSDPKIQNDELGKVVANISAKYSYFVLTGVLFVLWMIDRILSGRSSEFGNILLFIALCLALTLFPIIQFIISRKYN